VYWLVIIITIAVKEIYYILGMETQTQMGNLTQMQIEEVKPFQHVTKDYSVCSHRFIPPQLWPQS
jgi:hypothetical protein